MKKIIMFLMLVCLTQIAYALPPTGDLITILPFDDSTTSGSTSYDVVNTNNGTISGATSGAEGKLGEGYSFDGTEDYVTLANENNFDGMYESGSALVWIKPDVITGEYGLVDKGDTSSLGDAFAFYIGTSRLNFYYSDATGSNSAISTVYLATGCWQLVGASWSISDNNISLYINGSYAGGGVLTKTPSASADPVRFGKTEAFPAEYDGLADNVVLYNDFMTPEEHMEHWNGGSGFAYPYVSASASTSVTIDYPINNSGINGVGYPFRINGTVEAPDGLENLTINMTGWDLSWNYTGSDDTEVYFNYTRATLSDGYYTVNLTANDTDGDENSTLIYFTVDSTNPIITVTSPTNNTWYSDSVTVTASCSDANPYLLNYTFYNITNQFDSQQDMTAPLTLSDTVDTSELNSSVYYVNFTCSDSHTSMSIVEYDVVKDLLNNKITFNGDVSIKMYSNDVGFTVEDITTEKLMDRYNFDYGGSVNKGTYYFEIESNYPIVEVKNTGYKGHFVTGKYWIDFNNDDSKAIYNIIKVDKKTYRIGITTTSLNFNSIGELNTVKEFYIVNIDNENPTANLSSPTDDYYINESATYDFYCNATDNHGLDYMEFWTNVTGSWVLTDTDSGLTGTSDTSHFTLALSSNLTAEWGCQSCDLFSQCTYSLNRTFLVNITESVTASTPTGGEMEVIGTCYFTDDNRGGMYAVIFFFLLSAGVIFLGWHIRLAIVGIIGGFMLIISSLFLWTCFPIMAGMLTLLSAYIIWYFLSNGYRGRL